MHSSRTLRKRRKGRRNGVKLDLLQQKSISNSMQEVIGSKVGGYVPSTSPMRSKKEASDSFVPRRVPGCYSNPPHNIHAPCPRLHRRPSWSLRTVCTSPPVHRARCTRSVPCSFEPSTRERCGEECEGQESRMWLSVVWPMGRREV
jgi:hypothetical protein